MIKEIQFSEPMTLHRYNLINDINEISAPFKEGYRIVFMDGQVIWCPLDVYQLLDIIEEPEDEVTHRVFFGENIRRLLKFFNF